MGYTTDFYGSFQLDKPLALEHAQYLTKFAATRRMRRNVSAALILPDPVRLAAKLPIGAEAGYFVDGDGYMGQGKDPSIIDYNFPPKGQPGLWCHWRPSLDGTEIEWDGGEKFYDFVEWLEYLIDHFLKPWGYTLSGSVEWQGEDRHDFGKIFVEDNVVSTRDGRRVYDGEDD